jgi:putative transposase
MVAKLIQEGVSERLAYRALGLARASFRYEPDPERVARASRNDGDTKIQIRKLVQQEPRYGYKRISAVLRRGGERINRKRVLRLYREEGLQLPRRRPRKRFYQSLFRRPLPACGPNEVWCYDFLFDRTLPGESIKFLPVLDEYTRESLAIEVDLQLGSDRVIEVLERLVRERGAPKHIRSDNGPEFIADQLRRWMRSRGIEPIYIEPGCPWQNGFVESFNGKFRDECLNMELFWNKEEAHVIVEDWRRRYNQERPHSALAYLSPREFALAKDKPIRRIGLSR